MKKYKTTCLLLALLTLIMVAIFTGSCEPGIEPSEPAVQPTQPVPSEAPGAATRVKAKWSGGDIYYTQNDGTTITKWDGTNGDFEITEATITTGTITTATVTTLSNANIEMGSVNITSGNAASSATSHSLGSTPTICIATWQADPGGDGSLYFSTANSTHIVISSTANSSNNCAIDYVLWVSGE